MKGFIRVLEAIIASIILIASMTYFFIPQIRQSRWDDTVVNIQVAESLAALEKSGDLDTFVMNNDVTALDRELRKMVPPNVDFSVEISGIPNPIIRIACWCTQAQADDLETRILHPSRDFLYKGRLLDIRIETISNPDNMSSDTNILFVFGYQNLNNYANVLDAFLTSGGTIYMFSDLTSVQVNDGYLNTRFGLSWSSSVSGTGRFLDTITPSTISYKIAKYYQGLRNEDPSSVTFDGFSSSGIVTQSNRTIVNNPTTSYIKANEFVFGKGRTVWSQVYNYNNGGDPNVQEINNLTKAVVLWMSGEKYKMDTFKKNPAPTFSQVSYLSALNGFEPYEISLIFWKVFY